MAYLNSLRHGGPGGNSFSDDLTQLLGIDSITISSGNWIDRIEIVYRTVGGYQSTVVHGGDGGNPQTISFSIDEYIVSINGTSGWYINSLTITTNKSVYGPFGTQGPDLFSILGSRANPICGFFGSADKYLDAIGGFLKWNGDFVLPAYADINTIPLLDVWGEGRIVDQSGNRTGFDMAYNLNKVGQRISNGPAMNGPIPNLIPVNDYDKPEFPIANGIVQYITLMGAPITVQTAREIYRVLNKQNGVVILYNPDAEHKSVFEQNMGQLALKPNDSLNHPFDTISYKPAFIYGFGNNIDRDEL